MCLIIYKPFDRRLNRKRLQEAFNANPDGWGILGHGFYAKHVTSFESFYACYRKFKHKNLLIHFRTASSGEITRDNCHPFRVNPFLSFMANGNFYEFGNYYREWDDNLTDVQRFNRDILQKLPNGFLRNTEARSLLEQYCKDRMIKMAFMEHGQIHLINTKAGEWVKGCWYSNSGIQNYIGYGYSGAYYYKPNEVRHKGGLMSVQMFPEEKRKQWHQCPLCKGYFKGGVVDPPVIDVCYDCSIYLKLRGMVESNI